MSSGSFKELERVVILESESNLWDSAVLEWEVIGFEEDSSGQGTCVCGHLYLVEMFTIRNVRNGNVLHPIGNVCVHKFGRQDLNSEVALLSRLHKLRTAIPEQVSLTKEYFSRALLGHLDSKGAFTPDRWNSHNGKNDYQFLLDMFNKRDKDSITSPQHRKIRVLLDKKVIPFIQLSEGLG